MKASRLISIVVAPPNLETLLSMIEKVNSKRFLQLLSAVDQKAHKPEITSLVCGQPKYFWVFKNMDFKEWDSASSSRVLWLSGPPECSIHHVSSYIVHLAENIDSEKPHSVLYFSCSTEVEGKPFTTRIVHTLLRQIVSSLPEDEKVSAIRTFLHTLLGAILKMDDTDAERPHFNGVDSSDTTIRKILDVPNNQFCWSALKAVLADEQTRELSVVIDGLHEVGTTKPEKRKQTIFDAVEGSEGARKQQMVKQQLATVGKLNEVEKRRVESTEGVREFIEEVHEFVKGLQERTSKVKVLLTGQPRADIEEVFDDIPRIEYDKERKECIASLYFDNTRYDKILKEHESSLEWLWKHEQYREWSVSNVSRVLYIEGKPGSGKSTLTKYFKDNILKWEPAARSAVMAGFFYSRREGELQTSHYNMLRTILYDILNQNEYFFYHFQSEYRNHQASSRGSNLVKWPYDSLKRVLSSLRDHPQAERVYLIVDAVDESNDEDRRSVLELLLSLCSKPKYCVIKILVASRPLGQLDSYISKVNNFIRMQDETKGDISNFAHSFLNHLDFTGFLDRATEYIVENAQGVFLWVQLVKKELLERHDEGSSEEDIFEFLRSLPTELEDFYEHILSRMGKKTPDLRDGVKLFQFVLFARRPLTVLELLHVLGTPAKPDTEFTPSDELFRTRVPARRRIIHCGGNFLEIKHHNGNNCVQLIHQTVREFFLKPNGCVARSEFGIREIDAHISISITCFRYLMLCSTNTTPPVTLLSVGSSASNHLDEVYARYLDERPLINYALCHLKHHIDRCHEAGVLHFVSQFVDELVSNPAAYLLEDWISSHLNKHLFSGEKLAAAKQYRTRILHAAVRMRLPQVVELLLLAGTEVDSRLRGKTPLIVSAESWNDSIAQMLLEKGADVRAEDDHGLTALHQAAKYGREAMTRLLLEKGANIASTDRYGRTVLHSAVDNGHEAVAQLLIQKGASVTAMDNSHWTPLHMAANNGHYALVELFCGRGANVNARCINGSTALHLAVSSGHMMVVQCLFSSGADTGAKDGRGLTALDQAVDGGHEITTWPFTWLYSADQTN